MPKVEKVTVSLPAALFAYVEGERTRTGATRSETIAALLWQARQAAELAEREERYAAAYADQPETEEEMAWSLALSDEMFADAGAEWQEFAPARGSSPQDPDANRSSARRRAKVPSKGTTRAAR